MNSSSDFDLLRTFVERGSRDAFGELVTRHVDLVYTSAVRQVRDSHLAEDVTQAVFLVLLRKAPSIHPPTVLAGWLLNTTRFAARDALKSNRRRRLLEDRAARERVQIMSGHDPEFPGTNQERLELAPQVDAALDGALARLSPGGRDAIVLRFFQNMSFGDVGRQLGISEEAAKQRVFRALERLREIFTRGGVTLPAEYLSSMLLQCAVRPAPLGLQATVINATVQSSTASAASSAIAKASLRAMAWTKAKVAVLAILALVLGTAGVTAFNHFRQGEGDVVVATAASAAQVPVQRAAEPQFTWQSAPTTQVGYSGPPVTGVVTTPDGRPVAGATVLLGGDGGSITLSIAGDPQSAQGRTRTDGAGRFEFRAGAKPTGVAVTCPQGFARDTVKVGSAPIAITLRPWAQMQANIRVGRMPAAGADIRLRMISDQTGNIQFPWMSVKTDSEGRVTLAKMIPQPLEIGLLVPGQGTVQHWYRIIPETGTPTSVTVGGTGQTVVARVLGPIADCDFRDAELVPALPEKFRNIEWNRLTGEQRAQMSREMERSPEMREWSRTRDSRMYQGRLGADGALRLNDVVPGVYEFVSSCALRQDRFMETVAEASKTVTISEQAGDAPIDLGDIQMKVRKRLEVGKQVPPLTGKDADDHPFALGEHRGRFILLRLADDFQYESSYEAGQFRAMVDRFGRDPRFFVTNVYLHPVGPFPSASDPKLAVHWVRADELNLAMEYANASGFICLIDPDGKLVWKLQTAQRVWYTLERMIAGMPPLPEMTHIQIERIPAGQVATTTPYKLVPPPSSNDAGSDAIFTIVDGTPPSRANALDSLHDGGNAVNDDDRRNNFLFAIGTLEGRVAIDLKRRIPIEHINTYSWHKDTRGPQVYTVYGSDGTATCFNPAPKIGVDPSTCGWARIASVNTRPTSGPLGGRYAVQLGDDGRLIGTYRYLLFEMFPTETVDAFGHTFYSEIDVIAGK